MIKLWVYPLEDINRYGYWHMPSPLLYKTELWDRYNTVEGERIVSWVWVQWGYWATYKRREDMEFVDSPEEADYIVFPYIIDAYIEKLTYKGAEEAIKCLKWYKRYEEKHIFFSFHDRVMPFESKAIFFVATNSGANKALISINYTTTGGNIIMEKVNVYVYKKEELGESQWVGITPLLWGTSKQKEYFVEFEPKVHATNTWYLNDEIVPASTSEYINFVDSPEEADYVFFPYCLGEMVERRGIEETEKYIKQLPHYAKHEFKHVFYLYRGLSERFNSGAIFFRTGANQSYKDKNSEVISYVEEDLKELIHYNLRKIKYDISFIGCDRTCQVRLQAVEQLKKCKKLKMKIDVVDDYFGRSKFESVRQERIKMFRDSIVESLLTFCPRGSGENTMRFFEVMSLGRIPVFIGDSCVFPFEDKIDWNDVCLRIPEKDIPNMESVIKDYIKSIGKKGLLDKGKKARTVWEEFFSANGLMNQIFRILEEKRKAKNTYDNLDTIISNTQPIEGNKISYKGIEGHLFFEDIRVLYNAVEKDLRKKGTLNILEIGSFKGLSAIVMANALQGKGKITCVDSWCEEERFKCYDEFLENIKNYPNILHYRVNSADFKSNEKYDLIFVDGGHDYQSCAKDLDNVYPMLKNGGILFGHDYIDNNPNVGVKQAVEEFVAKNKLNFDVYPRTHGIYSFRKYS